MKNGTKIGIGIILVFMLICVVVPMNAAAGTGNLTVSYSFYYNPARQDETVTLVLTIRNDRSQEVRMSFIGIHLDWLEYNYYYTDQTVSQSTKKYLSVGEEYTSYIYFTVPIDASIGNHNWNICVS